jgi:N-acetylmuramoyl-L-alanine amidase-like protein/VCBS repeat protein
MRRIIALAAFCAPLAGLGCAGDEPALDVEALADDALDFRFEGDEVIADLDADNCSPVIEAAAPFVRLGAIWDLSADGGLELRTSSDGSSWSAWAAPEEVFAEEGARAGHVVVDGDPARFFQYRVTGPDVAPTYLVLEPIETFTPIEDVEDPAVGEAQSAITAGSIPIHSRASWGAEPAKCSSPMGTAFRAAVHHTAGPTHDEMSVPARLRQIQDFHIYSRGWCDIAYNYLVSRDGRVWTGRGIDHMGAHALNANTGNVGVSFIGTYTSTPATETQLCAAGELFRWIHQVAPGVSLNRTDVKGHRQYGGGTECPGDKLYGQIDAILARAKNGCAPNPPPNPESDEGVISAHLHDAAASTDVTGDGKADACARNGAGIRCFRATANGWAQSAIAGPDLSNQKGWDDKSNYSTLRFADIDGDGDADLCGRHDDGFRCWKSNGQGFGGAITTDLFRDAAGWDKASRYGTIRMGDVNGDGKADACGRAKLGFRCWLSNGHGFPTKVTGPAWSDDNGWTDPSNYDTIRMGDVNGDGKDDVCARNDSRFVCWLSNGSAFATKILGPLWGDDVWKDVDNWATIRLVDLNGDGKADVCGRGNLGFRCHLSNGAGFGAAIQGPALSNDNGWDDHQNYSTIRFGDIDGDGDQDLCARGNSELRCWKWTGTHFGAALDLDVLLDASGWDKDNQYRTIHLADLNGDGKADLCARANTGLRCFRSLGSDFGAPFMGPEWSNQKGWDRKAHWATIRFAGP